MKVICKENTARNLDRKEVANVLRQDHEYAITIGKEYIVMGLLVYKDTNCLYYLVDDGAPLWMPYGLFELTDKTFSPNWHLEIFDKKNTQHSNDFFLQDFMNCAPMKISMKLLLSANLKH